MGLVHPTDGDWRTRLIVHPSIQPHTFTGLLTTGKLIFILDLVLFTLITGLMTYRFVNYPGTFKASLTHPTESLFAATSLIALASIIACIGKYGVPECGPWLVTAFRVIFWIYYAAAWLSAIVAYVALFTNPELKIQDMTPGWDLPIFPIMLTGTVASAGSAFQPPDQAVPMIVAGLIAQGLGFWVSILMYASYLRRMIQYGFPSPASRPAMFIAVGPPSFTGLAIMGMAGNWPAESYNYFGGDPAMTLTTLKVLALVTALFLYSLSFWFFSVGVVSTVKVARELKFKLNWNAFVFPNVGFTIVTIEIGKQLKSEGVKWVGSIMTILLIALYLFVQVMCVRAVWNREVCFQGKDEDNYFTERMMKKEKLGAVGASGLEKEE
ncbi:Malic acid transport protein [Cyphellophora attinorum]|uniref:Malic acid transport protein n=1 Tax=Cyphellophora attinorum TaxID=1664694 RepID=A0A0N0NPK7_9EURO|nr:Malic acid transport protein [Phialophora attinorum]KPI42659.1 Malic acid transport protein [Phialophora attinorum]